MHIVFLTHEFPKPGSANGGVGTFVQTLGLWLTESGHKVSVIGINNTEYFEEENHSNLRVYRLPKRKVKGLTWLLQSRSIAQKIYELNFSNPIDVIEGTEMAFAFIPKLKGVKYLIRLHGGHHFFAESEKRGVNWWKGLQEKRSFAKADAIIGVSQYVVSHTSKYINFQEKFKGVFFNPANLQKFNEVDVTKEIKNRIFFAGTVCEKKGIRQLIQAMAIIKNEIPDAELHIAGRDWFFPRTGESFMDYLKQFIGPDLEGSIHFLGPLPNFEIPKYIETASVCCYPSHMEAMPLAWIEVMAMGKIFVGSNLGPGPEIIEDGVNGFMSNPLSPVDIADKIIWVLNNKDKVLELSKNARNFALLNFSLKTLGPRNVELYKSLL